MQNCQLLSISVTNWDWGLCCFEMSPSNQSNGTAVYLQVKNCRQIQKHLSMLVEHIEILCITSEGYVIARYFLDTLVKLNGGSGKIPSGFQTIIHCADAPVFQIVPSHICCLHHRTISCSPHGVYFISANISETPVVYCLHTLHGYSKYHTICCTLLDKSQFDQFTISTEYSFTVQCPVS